MRSDVVHVVLASLGEVLVHLDLWNGLRLLQEGDRVLDLIEELRVIRSFGRTASTPSLVINGGPWGGVNKFSL